MSDVEKRIEELERRVRDLEARPVYVPPVPYYPMQPYTPIVPVQPYPWQQPWVVTCTTASTVSAAEGER